MISASRSGPHAGTSPKSAIGRLRVVVRLLAMLMLLVACIPMYYLWRPFGSGNPWPRAFLAGVAWLAGMHARYHGHRVKRGALLIANHVSWIDIPVLAAASGTAFVAHDGLASVPLVRWLCRMNDTVFVARHDRTTIQQQVAQVRDAIRASGSLAVFPEGTTSDGTGLLPFKSSLLSAIDPVPPGIAIQPVWLDYGPQTADVAWVGEDHGMDNFLRILARSRPIRINVHFLEPLSGDALANRKSIARAARSAIAAAMSQRVAL